MPIVPAHFSSYSDVDVWMRFRVLRKAWTFPQANEFAEENAYRSHISSSSFVVVVASWRIAAVLRSPQCERNVTSGLISRRLYILCWRELSRRRLLPAVSPAAGHLTTPTVAGLPGLCENFRPTSFKSTPILRLQSSHWATSVVRTRVVGVATVGDSLRRLQWRRSRGAKGAIAPPQ